MTSADQTPQWPDLLPIAAGDMFALVAEHTHNAAIVTDPHYRILWANAAFTRVTGYTLDEARGRSPADFLRAPDSDPVLAGEIQDAIAHGRPFQGTLRNRRRDGSGYWIKLEGQSIQDKNGQLVAFLTVGTDVTAQVEREAALTRNEVLFNEAQRIARIGSWDYDLLTRTQQWSAETFIIHGLPPGDAPPPRDRHFLLCRGTPAPH
jgi:PAS domain S-box-containing protein